MVSFQDLREADAGTYDDLADRWALLAGQLTATATDLKTTLGGLDGWQGDAADTARAHFDDVRAGYDTAGEYLERIPPALRDLADAIIEAQRTVDGVMRAVDSSHVLSVDPLTGQVRAVFGGPGDRRTDEEKECDRQTAEELTGTVRQALRAVGEADQVASAALDEARPAAAGLELEAVAGGDLVTPSDLPGADASPAEVKRWWDSLTPMEQESAIYTHGDVLGGTDGIPVEARDRANRIRFAEEHAELRTRRETLAELGDGRTADQDHEYRRLGETLRGLDAIAERLDRDTSDRQPRAYLLDYSTEGNGRGIVATGNPDTADNVVTSVPGTGSDLAGIGGELDRSDLILAEAGLQSRGSETAAITWVGYDAPQDLIRAADADYAEAAAGDLRDFQDGLRVTHEGAASNNTVIGHSYGSTVIGHSAQGAGTRLDVDNVIFLGSPGVGVEHASDLRLPQDTNVYASTAENDVIRATPDIVHGPQPVSEDFGAKQFTSDPGTDGEWYTGGYSTDAHSEYWHKDSASLRNMATIVLGGQPS
ncbi:alpha/beta hydrolase family protein [Prauserella shujinwangii]|uniref:Alpha/beta hydrolase family protein n=1 Tax=Prauserella shujinwangii TaxID=1453103 RepID=A0A2T0LY14_9PSEU|nr:alpha/beta hydrolase [Prauserella shujinwangii]PRX49008.1 alpha/beta hydrolase family protein [Prauserella shujinwangii]